MTTTSTTLLCDISQNTTSPRWNEFAARYKPPLEAYLKSKFPSLEAEDILQETFAAVARALPDYHYSPDEKGRFRNFLIGILRHKAIDALRKNSSRAGETFDGAENTDPDSKFEEEWRETVYAAALEEFLASGDLNARHRQIFIRTAINGERVQDVAESLAMPENTVSQIKRRMIAKLREIVDKFKSIV